MFEAKGFFLVDDNESKLRLVREAAKSACPITVWTKSKAVLFRATISSFDFSKNTFRAEIPKDLSLQKVLSIVESGDGVFLKVDLPSTTILFRTEIFQFSQGNPYLDFKFPKDIYKIQQRKHPRIDVRNDSSIRVFHDDPLQAGRKIRRKVNDISVGGLAVQLFLGEERHYHVGQKLSHFQVQIGSKILICWASIRNIRVVIDGSKPSGLIMGVELQGLDDSKQKQLSNFIDRKMIRQFSSIVDSAEQTDSDPEKKRT
ncbi:MAG: PilZ domain-containing protein [Bdellovibrionales bacterium]|nr:PilZ domain-containing protein [Bdellovibrionales bacterium]